MNEAQIIANVIIPDLDEKGWKSHDIFHYKVEFKIDGADTPRYADIILFALHKPIGVIEVKKTGADLNMALNQAKSYAEDLGAELIYATDGTDYVQFNAQAQSSERIDGIPTVQELHKNHNFHRYE
jgi:type I restriction enzyme R subunit